MTNSETPPVWRDLSAMLLTVWPTSVAFNPPPQKKSPLRANGAMQFALNLWSLTVLGPTSCTIITV